MTAKSTNIWFPFFTAAYLKKTTKLSTVGHGAYLMLLISYYSDAEALPDDDEELASITRLPLKEWQKIRPKLARFFTIENGVWRQERADEEIEKRNALSSVRSSVGKSGAASKKEKAAAALANASPEQLLEQTGNQIGEQTIEQTAQQEQQQTPTHVRDLHSQSQSEEKKEAKAEAVELEPAKAPLPTPAGQTLAERGAAMVAADPDKAAARAIISAFDEVQAEIYADRRRPNPASKDWTTACHWVAQGADVDLCRWIFETQTRKMFDAGKEPPRTLSLFGDDVLNSIGTAVPAGSGKAAAPTVDRPYEDHATTQWRSRLEGFRDFAGAWSQAWGPKPPGLGQPRPRHADYPEALAIEVGVSGPADADTDKPGNGGKVRDGAPSAPPNPERLRENSPGKAPPAAAGEASAWHAALDMWLQIGIFLQSRPGKPFGQVGCECPVEILVERLGSNWEEEIAATIAARSRVGAA